MFIIDHGFARLSTPLSNLTKSGKKWFWCDKCACAFDDLKEALCTAPCLALPDFDKTFVLSIGQVYNLDKYICR